MTRLNLPAPGHMLRALAAAVGVALVALLAVVPTRSAALAWTTLYDVRALHAAYRGSGQALTTAARALARDGQAWRAELEPLLQYSFVAGHLPYWGGVFEAAPGWVELVDSATTAVEPSLELVDALYARLDKASAPGAAILATAQEDGNLLRKAQAAVDDARHKYAALDTRAFPPEARQFTDALGRGLDEWAAALTLLERSPQLLGADAPRRYLVLAQNNDELRATGGFISAAGILKIERGKVTVEWFGDSFAADDLSLIHPPPPAPLQKYMWASQWLLRDSNWSPDFPTSARQAQSMVRYDRHVQTDGVIAVDTRFMPRLVGAVGSLQLGEETLTAGNVVALLQASWKPLPPGDMSPAWFTSDRKNFLSELFQSLLEQVETGELEPAPLAQAFAQGLQDKSVQVYLNDAIAEAALVRAGWGGAVEPGTGDYLFVVDSNVGFNKVNARVTRSITYTVRLRDDGGEGTVEIRYENPSRAAEGECDLLNQHKDATYASMEESCYWDYVRVLAPRGSQLVSADGIQSAEPLAENQRAATFGGYAIVPRSATRTIRLVYTLPDTILKDNAYTLKLQAQAGAADTPVTLRIELPPGRTVRAATLPFRWLDERTVEIQTTLTHDGTIGLDLDSIH